MDSKFIFKNLRAHVNNDNQIVLEGFVCAKIMSAKTMQIFLEDDKVYELKFDIAIKKINEANPNSAYVTMQGFEALKELSKSPSAKIVVPTEIANVTSLLSAMKETIKETPTTAEDVEPTQKKNDSKKK